MFRRHRPAGNMPPPRVPVYLHDDEEEEIDATQPSTQPSTQPMGDSQPLPEDFSHLWGRLVPCTPGFKRLDFHKTQKLYKIGRNDANHFKFKDAPKISGLHCTIQWFNDEAGGDRFVLIDKSSNGTYVNGTKHGREHHVLLHEGDEVSFCQPGDLTMADYRWIFRWVPKPDPEMGGGLYEHYSIGEPLGKGAFAVVKSGIHLTTGEHVAVKCINKKRVTGSLTMFARERMILQSLDHPGVCSAKAFFEDPSTIYMVMEFVAGGDLLDYISRRTSLSEEETKHFTRHICEAVAYTHANGVTHRDLKPDNILVVPATGDTPAMPKIADFGLAKAVDSQTFLRTMCGTPAYLAPEVVKENGRGYSNLVDSWSIGVIVFCMLVGHSPFVEDPDLELRETVEHRAVQWEFLEPYNFSDHVVDFLHRLINPDPDERLSVEEALSHPWLAPTPDTSIDGSYTDDETPARTESYSHQSSSFTVNGLTASSPSPLPRMKVESNDGLADLHMDLDPSVGVDPLGSPWHQNPTPSADAQARKRKAKPHRPAHLPPAASSSSLSSAPSAPSAPYAPYAPSAPSVPDDELATPANRRPVPHKTPITKQSSLITPRRVSARRRAAARAAKPNEVDAMDVETHGPRVSPRTPVQKRRRVAGAVEPPPIGRRSNRVISRKAK